MYLTYTSYKPCYPSKSSCFLLIWKLFQGIVSHLKEIICIKTLCRTYKLQDNCLEIWAIFGFGKKHEEELASLVLQINFLLLPKYHLNYKTVTMYPIYLQSKSLQSCSCYEKWFLQWDKICRQGVYSFGRFGELQE